MSAEDNLSPKQFKWTPNKYGRNVLWHMRDEHTDMTPEGGWSRTLIDERAHEAAHAAAEDGVHGTKPHKHFTPKQFKKY
jgi:hypothetical protein